MLKSVLPSLSIFLLSFYRTSMAVYKEIRRIQSNFLWGDKAENKTINWVGRDQNLFTYGKRRSMR